MRAIQGSRRGGRGGRLGPLAALLTLGCGIGTLSTDPGRDAGVGDADGEGDAGEPVDCEGVLCPPGQDCVEGRCRPPDPCEGVSCPAGETCSAGRCVPEGTDEDRDGYPAERDCDDRDASIRPGVEVPCTTGCGPGEDRCQEDGTWSGCRHETDPCELPHAAAACVDGSCVVVACAEGHSNCDDIHSNGCETVGECAGPGLACGELIECVLSCPDDTCAALCALRACRASNAAMLALLDCGSRLCDPACSEPSSPECQACITTSCGVEYGACLEAGC